jgi:hypothetical protein
MSKIILKTYQEVLEEIDGKENHLLLGNGFNMSLGVHTDYKSIFEEMKKKYAAYQSVEGAMKKHGYDLEKIIGEFEMKIEKGENFLSKFIHNKIQLDFMKAASRLTASQVNKVYQEKNEGIHLLLKNFSTYFTLNYDPFLYLLLMKFKENKNNDGIAFQHTFQFIEADLNEEQNDIYTKIKEARNNGQLSVHVNGNGTSKKLRLCTKTEFSAVIKTHFKDEEWTPADIAKAVGLVWGEENESHKITTDDGFRQNSLFPEPVFNENNETQNLFFLHGAFHIYKEGDIVKKVTQQSEKALYNRLEEIINNEEGDIVCVFSNENKINEIEGSEYLKKAYYQLSQLSGSVVILGCSFSENDKHIFDQLKKSQIDTIYISSTEKKKEEAYKNARELFDDKNIVLFDRETISYEK